MKRAGGLAYREAGPSDGPVALLVHGYPESSYMWRHVLPAAAEAGWRALAPDLVGFGDSPAGDGTWEGQMDALERFRGDLTLDRVALVVHDWGGLIGLRWACEHADGVRALVISDTGFFPDGQWHGLAQGLRTPGTGEALLENMTKDAFAAVLRQSAAGIDDAAIDEYWKAFEDEERRRGQLDLYRSGDFEKLEPYQGRLAELGVPTLILWGAKDEFAPVAGAHRFSKEIPGSELTVLDGAGHFVFEDAPDEAAAAVAGFLRRLD